ncbi:Uncharacterized protein APZ42_003257, partial [Daphnia magna]
LFRPGRDQLHRRRAGDRLPPAGARAVPRVRPDQAGLQPRQPEEEGSGAHHRAAAGRRRHGHAHDGPSAAALGDHGAASRLLRDAPAGRRSGRDRRRRVGRHGRPPQDDPAADPVCDRPVRPARRPGDRLRRPQFRGRALAPEPDAARAGRGCLVQSRHADEGLGRRDAQGQGPGRPLLGPQGECRRLQPHPGRR